MSDAPPISSPPQPPQPLHPWLSPSHSPELSPHSLSSGSGSLADTLFRIALFSKYGVPRYLEFPGETPLPWDVDGRSSRRKDLQGIKEVRRKGPNRDCSLPGGGEPPPGLFGA